MQCLHKFIFRRGNRGLNFNLHVMDEWRYIIMPNFVIIMVGVVTMQFPTVETLNILNIIKEIINAVSPLVCSLSGVIEG